MKIRVWGCRGSIPAPGRHTMRYGGNTTCIEVREPGEPVVIIDAGSGLRNLGKALARQDDTREIRMFLTHSHWDHLMGFPFFEPAYSAKYHITLCGGPQVQNSVKRYLSRQMEAPYFPVDFDVLQARFSYQCDCPKLEKGQCAREVLGCMPVPMNHPNGGYGFRMSSRGRTFVFLPDNELGFLHPGGCSREQYADFCRGADLLMHDAQFTEEEYTRRRGWGHSTFEATTDLALAAGVKRLGLFHHDPDRDDDELDRQVEACRDRIRRAGGTVECFAAAEGMEIDL